MNSLIITADIRFFLKFLLRKGSNPSLSSPASFYNSIGFGLKCTVFSFCSENNKRRDGKVLEPRFLFQKKKPKRKRMPTSISRKPENLGKHCLPTTWLSTFVPLYKLEPTVSHENYIGTCSYNNQIVPLEVNFWPDNWISHICLVKSTC